MAAKPLDIWQTPSSTHWQYPPKRSSTCKILWLLARETNRVLINIWGTVPIRENKKGRVAEALRCWSGGPYGGR